MRVRDKRYLVMHPAYLPMIEEMLKQIEKKGTFSYHLVGDYVGDYYPNPHYWKRIRIFVLEKLVKFKLLKLETLKNGRKKYYIDIPLKEHSYYKYLCNVEKSGTTDINVFNKIKEITKTTYYWTIKEVAKSLKLKITDVKNSIERLKRRGILESRDDIEIYAKYPARFKHKKRFRKKVVMPVRNADDLLLQWYT